jgi:hypothetical protein
MLSPIALAVSLLAQAPAQPGTMSRAEQEEFLRTAKVVAQQKAKKGITESYRNTLEKDGFRHDAHFQHIDERKSQFNSRKGTELNFKDCYRFNVAAYELSKVLGIDDMIPTSVERRIHGDTGALTWWVDDVAMDEERRYKKQIQPPHPAEWNREMQVVRVFDQLIANTDRNLGNLLITKDWKIWMIDHTRAFRAERKLLSPANVTGCDRALVARMRELTPAVLKERIGRWVDKMELEGLLARRDAILAKLEAEVKEKGEGSVLFDRPKRD